LSGGREAFMRDAAGCFHLDLAPLLSQWAAAWKLHGLEGRLHISFSTRMTRSLGRCHPERRAIRLASWLREAPAALFVEVLCHEAAHVAAFELHGRGCRPHGAEWKTLMRAAGFEPRVRVPVELLPESVLRRNAARSRRSGALAGVRAAANGRVLASEPAARGRAGARTIAEREVGSWLRHPLARLLLHARAARFGPAVGGE
jgi:hypothetical protein